MQSDIDRLRDLLKKRQDIFYKTKNFNKRLDVKIDLKQAHLENANLIGAI